MNFLRENGEVDKRMRVAKTDLDYSVDILIRAVQRNSDQETCVTKAERTLGKAVKIILGLAWSLDDKAHRRRSRRKMKKSVAKASQKKSSSKGAKQSLDRVSSPVQEYLSC